MPFENIPQPQIIQLSDTLRLRKYDGHFEICLPGYQDPYVYQNSEGIFDEAKIPTLNYVEGMCKYLSSVGEFYFIEALEDGHYRSVGDVTVKPENPPIAIWYPEYRSKGVGTLAMQAVITRLRELGYEKITGTTIYKWNQHSLNLHKKLGFEITSEDEKEYQLALML